MNKNKPLFFLGALWEIARFVLVLFYIYLLFGIHTKPTQTAFLIWLGSTQLVLAGTYTIIGFYPKQYLSYFKVIILGKLLNIIPDIFVLIIVSFTALLSPETHAFKSIDFLLPIIITLFDILAFLCILTYNNKHGNTFTRDYATTFDHTPVETSEKKQKEE